MLTFLLNDLPASYVIALHIDNFEHWLAKNNTTFETEWNKFQENEYSVDFNFRNNIHNLMNTYGEAMLKECVDLRLQKSA